MTPTDARPLRPLEIHVLLALADGPRYGYAVKTSVEDESDGRLRPGAGTLYRVLARLMSAGLVAEVDPPDDGPAHPGLPRRYYELTAHGVAALGAEARRLSRVADLAAERLGPLGEDRP